MSCFCLSWSAWLSAWSWRVLRLREWRSQHLSPCPLDLSVLFLFLPWSCHSCLLPMTRRHAPIVGKKCLSLAGTNSVCMFGSCAVSLQNSHARWLRNLVQYRHQPARFSLGGARSWPKGWGLSILEGWRKFYCRVSLVRHLPVLNLTVRLHEDIRHNFRHEPDARMARIRGRF